MSQDKMKRFIECYVPVRTCNMKCEYCYVTQNGWWSDGLPDLSVCGKKMKEALTKERLGGTCMINMCGTGETLLPPEMPDIIKGLLENGHYVMVVTNGTMTKRFEEMEKFPGDLRKRLFYKFSFHYLELKRLGKMEEFFENVQRADQAGISFTVELTPDDSYIPYINEIKEICQKKLGALCHVTVTRDERREGYPLLTKLPRETFVETWKDFDSELFRFKEAVFGVKRKEFCYAGLWSFNLNMGNGDVMQCYKGKCLGNIYQSEKPIDFYPVGNHCKEGHCINAHAFMTFGVIPEADTPCYAEVRNRKTKNGTEWLKPEMKEFMQRRLKEANQTCSSVEKLRANLKSFSYREKIYKILKKT